MIKIKDCPRCGHLEGLMFCPMCHSGELPSPLQQTTFIYDGDEQTPKEKLDELAALKKNQLISTDDPTEE